MSNTHLQNIEAELDNLQAILVTGPETPQALKALRSIAALRLHIDRREAEQKEVRGQLLDVLNVAFVSMRGFIDMVNILSKSNSMFRSKIHEMTGGNRLPTDDELRLLESRCEALR